MIHKYLSQICILLRKIQLKHQNDSLENHLVISQSINHHLTNASDANQELKSQFLKRQQTRNLLKRLKSEK